MPEQNMRNRLDVYVQKKYNARPEPLGFAHQDYSVYRHADNGKWFAVLISKPRREFGLTGDEYTQIMSVKISDTLIAARDPIGIRPLYYGYTAGGSVVFASEPKNLTEI
ncbi:MAG: hypothetical protein IJ072_06345, partial [Oscillospiraceae bacterium]|nr:hypothetical protein [Oscillospiraceae bacterium]